MTDALETLDEKQAEMRRYGYCGVKNRNVAAKGDYCLHRAGSHTDHLGEGPCWLHGGALMNGKISRYSKLKNRTIGDLYDEHEEDTDTLNTLPEIALVRGMLEDYINRYDLFSEALLAWHQSYSPGIPHQTMIYALRDLLNTIRDQWTKPEREANIDFNILNKFCITALGSNPKPQKILDIADALKLAAELTRMVERVGKLQAATAISKKDFLRLMAEISNIIDQTVTDDKIKTRIRNRFATLRFS